MFGWMKRPRPTHVLCQLSPKADESVFAQMGSPWHIRKLGPDEPIPIEKKPNFSEREYHALMRERQQRGTKPALCGRDTHFDLSDQVDHSTISLSDTCSVCKQLFLEERPEFK